MVKTNGFLFAFLLFLVFPGLASASDCEFVLGFKAYRDQVGHDVVGDCLGNEHVHTGGARQWTTNGALLWDRKTGTVTFVQGAKPLTPVIRATPRPHLVAGELKPALNYLRSTGPWGRYWHSRIYEWKTNVIFECFPRGRSDTYGYAYAKVNQIGLCTSKLDGNTAWLATIIVHEMAHIRWHRSEGGRYIKTSEECYLKEMDGELEAENWLKEAGRVAEARRLRTTLEEVKRVWKEQCELFGS